MVFTCLSVNFLSEIYLGTDNFVIRQNEWIATEVVRLRTKKAFNGFTYVKTIENICNKLHVEIGQFIEFGWYILGLKYHINHKARFSW